MVTNNKKARWFDDEPRSGASFGLSQLLLALWCWMAMLVVPAFAGTSDSDSNLSFELKTLATGSSPFESDNLAGNDTGEDNEYLRTLDVVSYEVQFTTFKELSDTTVTVLIPKELDLSDVPAYCNTGSSLVDNTVTGEQTLTCTIPGNNPSSDPDSTLSQSSILALPLQLTALTLDRLGNYVANGTVPASVTANVTATSFKNGNGKTTTSSLNSVADDLIISARPKFDLDIKSLDNPIYRIVEDDDTGETGVIYQVPILVKVENGKGTEALIEDIVFEATIVNATDPASAVPYRVVNWSGAPVKYDPGCFGNSYLDGKQGRTTFPYGYYETDYPDRSIAGNATYTCTQASAGEPITVRIADVDSSALHTPDYVHSGASLSADDKYIVAGLLNYWIPLSYVDANGGEVTLKNNYTELTTKGVSGVNNAETDLSNNTTNNYTVITTRGSFTSYYVRNYSSGRGQVLAPMTSTNAGNGVVMPTQVYGYRMYGNNNGALAWNGGLVDDGAGGYTGEGFSMCTRIDNRTYVLDPLSTTSSIAHRSYETSTKVAHKIEYGTGGDILSGGVYYYDTDGDGDPLTNGQTTFEDMRTETCGEANSPSGWYSDIRDVPGGPEAVTKVRIVALEPLEPGARFDVGLNLKALTVDPISNVSLPEGILMPAYTTRTNYNSSTWVNTTYQPSDHSGQKAYGDRLRLTRALARIEKTTLPNDEKNSVLAGQTLEYQLAPTFTSILKPAPDQSYDVVVTDTLPERLSYVANSASRVPDSVTVNADGTTTIIWTLPEVSLDSSITPITLEAKAKFDTSNGTDAINTVMVDSIADGSGEEDRTATRTVVIGNSGAFNVVKESLTPLVAPGDNISYQLSFANIGSSDLSTGDFIDILPYGGDDTININDDPAVLDIPGSSKIRDPATNFTPTPSGTVNLLAVTPSYANESFLYTKTPSADLFIDPTHSSNLAGGSTQWCTEAEITASTSGCPQSFSEITAIRILTPDFPKNGTTRNVLIELEHDGEAAQLQTNSFGGRVDGIIGLVYSDATTEMELPAIGVAKNATVSDGPLPLKYTVTYDFYLKNLSPLSSLGSLSLPDDLSSVFGQKTVDWDFVSLTKVSGPGTIEVNATYDGATVIDMIGAGSSLASGESAQLQLVVEVFSSPGTYTNQVTVSGEDAVGNVYTDLSNDGIAKAIDTDGDGLANEMDTGNGEDENSDENVPTSIILYGSDYGDAPISFGDAVHLFTDSPSVYLGSVAPDSEAVSQQGSDAGLNARGDDADSSGDDEDGVSNLPVLLAGRTDYSFSVACTGNGIVAGWVDFDLSGSFSGAEQNSNHPVTCAGGSASLSWSGLSGLEPGVSYLRVRTATAQAELESAEGQASDGEVEDYPIMIETTSVSGRVYRDANTDTVNDSSETGVSSLPVVLIRIESNSANNSCVSARTNGNGDYLFENVFAGTYQVYEASRESVPTPRNCGTSFAKDSAAYVSTTANVRAEFTVFDTSVTGQDFGDVKRPILEPSNMGQVLAGNVLFYAHKLTTPAKGSVSFSSVSSGNKSSGWSSIIYRDVNCDGSLNGTEGASPISTGSIPVDAEAKVCLINKVYAPSNVAANDRYVQNITADFDFENTVAGTLALIVRDVTTALQVVVPALPATPEVVAEPVTPAQDPVDATPTTPYIPEIPEAPAQAQVDPTPVTPAVGPSRLELRKTVQNTTQSSAETATVNQAAPGDTLKYRIYYSNTGTGPLTELTVNDNAQAFTSIKPNSAVCGTPPSGMTCTPVISDDRVKWEFVGPLIGGASGVVSYDVEIDD
ncbi:SdrD B-like domain-containing protein [Leucothrix mucor]|uniref:SdrD B-like domain-containing protein n=1 Tax=Leucothrix mucor TaxID=45248 RepID=UPI0003B4B1BC|nr:SdrD B-like domain-containing protein [Leucothrix mucor]